MLLGAHNAVASTHSCAFINAVATCEHTMLLLAHNDVLLMLLRAHNAVLLMLLGAHDAVILMLMRAQNAVLLIFSCLFTASAESSHRNDTYRREENTI